MEKGLLKMKMIKWFLISLLLFPLILYAQVEVKNYSLIDPDINILYIGIENRIEVEGIKDTSNLRLTSATGEVLVFKWSKSNEFFIIVRFVGKDTLKLYQNEKLILTKIYEVKKIGDPIAQLGRITNSIATIEEILSDPVLSVVIPDSKYNIRAKVSSFESYIIQNDDSINIVKINEAGSIDTIYMADPEPPYETHPIAYMYQETEYIYVTNGNKLLPHHITEIKKLKSGDKLVLHEIIAVISSGSSRKLDPIRITIK